jgi:hypothetical protein
LNGEDVRLNWHGSDPTAAEQIEFHRLFMAVSEAVGREVGLVSRWSGRAILVSMDAPFLGQMTAHGDALVRVDRWRNHALRLRTVLHEAIHGYSADFTTNRYNEMPGWEEGVVEQLTRLLRDSVSLRVGITLDPTAEAAEDETHAFNPYIDPLERFRAATGIAEEEFYLRLLAAPVERRLAMAHTMVTQAVRPAQRAEALIGLLALDRVLREKIHVS